MQMGSFSACSIYLGVVVGLQVWVGVLYPVVLSKVDELHVLITTNDPLKSLLSFFLPGS